MMILILTLILGLLGYFFNRQIRKAYPYILTILFLLSALSLFVDGQVFTMITGGFLGLAFIVVVMFAGGLKKRSKVSKKLRSIRKEYSIFGVILLLPHGLIYALEFINGTYATEWYGIMALIIMIPLFIMSFGFIKKRMNIKEWFKLQKFAYIAYLLTFIHLIIISDGANYYMYIIIFSVYLILKTYNYILVNTRKLVRVIACLAIALIGFKLCDISFDSLSSDYEGETYTEEQLIDGVYTGYSTGYQNLEVEVIVTIEDGVISDIEVIESGTTSARNGTDFEQAVYDLAEEIVEEQSTDLDTVSGVTKSTTGLLEAVEDALSQALSDAIV